jgi:hypothetical protein
MKKIIKNLSKGVFILMLFFATSCSLSTNELAEEVKISINETFKNEGVTGLKLRAFFSPIKVEMNTLGYLKQMKMGKNSSILSKLFMMVKIFNGKSLNKTSP